MLFGKKKRSEPSFDPARQQPAVRKSICTGEMTGGYIDRETGRFHELELLRTQEELGQFCARLGVRAEDVKTIY
jgi:hypothetical protein